MSSEAPDQPATEDVSFADILEQPEVSEPPSAGAGKAAEVAEEADTTRAPAENGDVTPETTAAAAPPADGSGEPSAPEAAPEPMDVSDGPPGAAGDAGTTAAGGSGGVAPPPGVVKPGEAEAGTGTAPEAPATAAADTPAPELPAAATDETPAPSSAEAAAEAPADTKEAQAAEPASEENPGSDPASKETPGSDPASKENAGSDSTSKENPGSDPTFKENPGSDPASKENAGSDSDSKETPGSDPASKENAGSDSASKENPGSYSASKENPSSDPASKENEGSDLASKEDPASNPAPESKTEKAVDPAPETEAPAATPAPAPASEPTPASKPAAKAAAKAGPAPKKAATDSQTRPIPPDAEPIRVFSSVAAVAGPKPKPKTSTPEPEPEPLTELGKLWKPVKQNPADFTAWTLLIQYVEAQCFMEDIRDVLKAFLARYPYCYGYWKKYADLEKKRGTPELCNQAFERGLSAVALSVDLWLHYLHHMRAVCEDRTDLVRAAFERAVATCGTEFRSDRLWEQYASWESNNKDPVKALAVYKRAIAVPTLSYRTHFENLEQFVGETPPQELLTVGEFLDARRAVLTELKASEPPAAAAPPSSDLLPPGCDEPPPGVPAQPAGLSADEECVKLRAKILAPLRQLHKDTEKQVSLRWNFEEGIKRPYFHVKPLEKIQLKNWKAYLDFEIEQGDKERIRVLFERCMISCALYEEYWIKYIRYLESREPVDPDQIRTVFRRACWTHLPNKPAIHLMWATFEEKQGDLETAAEVMEKISAQVTMLEVTLRRINLARRAGRLDTAEQMYADALKNTQHRETAVIIGIKFIRFLYKVRDDRGKALDVLREAIHHDQTNMRLYMQMVDIGFQNRPVDVALVDEAFRMALAAPFEQKDKLTLAHRRVEFLEEFANDVESLQVAQDQYYGLLRAAKAEAKKKKQEEEQAALTATGVKRTASGSGSSTNGTEKKARVEPGAGSGTQIPTITETPARPAKTAPYRAPTPVAAVAAPAGHFNQRPPGYGGFNQPPPGPHQQQQQQYQYPGAGYQQQGAQGWPGYPPQYNYNQYGQGQGYQYPYQ